MTPELASKAITPKVAFTYSYEPRQMYAIERAAYGDAKTPEVAAFRDAQTAQVRNATRALWLVGLVTFACTGTGAIVLALQASIKRRLRRIGTVLKPFGTK